MNNAQLSPLVSVILPTYNHANFLPRAIESVLNQDFPNFELVVIDDGSTDQTPELLTHFRDPRIHSIRFEQNRGIGAARNVGVQQAGGNLIAFIDSDDVYLPGKLAKQFRIMSSYPNIDLCFSNYNNINHISNSAIDGFEQTKAGFSCIKTISLNEDLWQITDGLPKMLLKVNIVGTCSVVMFRRAIIEQIGNFCVDLSGPEDFEFLWRAAVKGVRFAYTSIPLVERHKNEQSITANAISFAPHYLKALDKCGDYALENERFEILPEIQEARYKVWSNLVRAYALLGKRANAAYAFLQSLKYGFKLTGLIYFMAAMAGPSLIAKLKKLRLIQGFLK